LLVGLAGVGCAPNRAPAQRFIEQAEQLHSGALASTTTNDEDLTAYVQELGRRLEKAADDVAPDKARGPFFKSLQFHLVNSPIVNVFTTGGSHIYVYRGLLDFCTSEEELAAAMAHAYAHALNLDPEQIGIKPGEKPRALRVVAWDFVVNRFTLLQEQESDKLAFRIYARAGWDPARFQVLFTRLSDQYGGPAALDRQPLSSRAAASREWMASAGISPKWRQLPVADPRTFDGLRKHASGLPFAGDASTEARLYLLAFPNCILQSDIEPQRKAQQILRPPPPPTVPVEPN
jgi:predicted Zn-dependent protease